VAWDWCRLPLAGAWGWCPLAVSSVWRLVAIGWCPAAAVWGWLLAVERGAHGRDPTVDLAGCGHLSGGRRTEKTRDEEPTWTSTEADQSQCLVTATK